MIKYYCQYSYGGFKTFHIEGVANEPLTQIVTPDCKYDMPEQAELYFNKGSLKLLYRYLDNDILSLIVKEIPSNGLDTDGRQISCAIQFIGNAPDRVVMDRLTIKIANDIKSFERSFANMFDLRGGLHFEGDKLDAFVKDCQQKCTYKGKSELLNVLDQKSGTLLFVPYSDNFGRDNKVTSKILDELQLPDDACDKKVFISLSKLEEIQYLLRIDQSDNNDDESCDDSEQHNHATNEEVDHLRAIVASTKTELDIVATKYEGLRKMACLLGLIFCILLFVLIITKCVKLPLIILGITMVLLAFETYKMYKR